MKLALLIISIVLFLITAFGTNEFTLANTHISLLPLGLAVLASSFYPWKN